MRYFLLTFLFLWNISRINSISHHAPCDVRLLPSTTEFPWGQEIVDHWLAAREVLGKSDLQVECYERLEIMAYLMNQGSWLSSVPGVSPAQYGGVLNMSRGNCEAVVNGVRLVYVRIYKGGNDFICFNFRAIDQSHQYSKEQLLNMQTITFSIIRDPFSHFVSGFSEVIFRARYHSMYHSSFYLFQDDQVSHEPKVIAERFIYDFILGHFHRVRDVTDVHVFPQVGFLASEWGKLDFLGWLSDGGNLWDELARRTALLNGSESALEFPAYDPNLGKHPNTSRPSTARLAMEHLVSPRSEGSMSKFRAALCHALIPDYQCLPFEFPEDCQIVAGSLSSECPLDRVPGTNPRVKTLPLTSHHRT